MNNLLRIFLQVLITTAVFAFGACDSGTNSERPGAGDGDADSDSDADSDGDSDSDSDVEEAELILPIERDDAYALELETTTGTLLFECTADNGGRITRFEFNDVNILVGPEDGSMFGATFWTSPQNWGWPPPDVFDNESYDVDVDESTGTIVLSSSDDNSTGVQIIKTFEANLAQNAIDITYTLRNTGDSTVSYSPWEISRVPEGGLTFFRQGSGGGSDNNYGTMDTQVVDGIVWYEHPLNTTSDNKLFDDSEDGWIAHTDGNLLFIKTFDQADEVPSSEGEIEIYATTGYVEVEQQGSYVALASGEELSWNLTWRLIDIPDNISVKAGSGDLVTLVDDAI
ncbi:MAG: DUF4380 domain-containing protein [Deltaproteobacteria bacterium]|nr:DUF4380 domain-containing protein [Deltaproteobacteria bacterium]